VFWCAQRDMEQDLNQTTRVDNASRTCSCTMDKMCSCMVDRMCAGMMYRICSGALKTVN